MIISTKNEGMDPKSLITTIISTLEHAWCFKL